MEATEKIAALESAMHFLRMAQEETMYGGMDCDVCYNAIDDAMTTIADEIDDLQSEAQREFEQQEEEDMREYYRSVV